MPKMNIVVTVLLTILWAAIFPLKTAWSGNQVLIEKRVQELDQLNRKLLSQETEIPRDGHLELKAEARYGAEGAVDIRVYSRKFSTIAEEPIRFNGKQTPVPSN